MKNMLRALSHNPLLTQMITLLDAFVVRASSKLSANSRQDRPHVLLTTTGHGNIGDQAMFEAFLRNVPGDIIAVMPNSGAFEIPEQDRARVVEVPLKNLIYGRGPSHYQDLARFGKILRSAQSFSVTGADIMDGGYNPRLSEMEWTTAIAAKLCGVPTQVLGFSWNDSPAPSALALARWAGKIGVRLHVRDPRSFQRLESAGVKSLIEAADTVFLLGESDTDFKIFSKAEAWNAAGRPIALVNCSGLIDTSRDLVADYVAVVRHLISESFEVVLVPHVIRPDSNDLAVSRRVQKEVGASEVYLLETLLNPRHVKALAELADVIVTGRMHLSVLGLSVATPSVVLATQGKVEGLMSLFDRPQWNIAPQVGFSNQVIDVLKSISSVPRSVHRQHLTAALSSVNVLSSENFFFVQDQLKVKA